jgi:phosphatidylglycerol---prolipoprotein diacylglyceryl transferase
VLPVLFEIVLNASTGTVVAYILAVVIPALFAWRAYKDGQAGYVEKDRWKKSLVMGVVAGLAAVTFFIRPWTWDEPLSIPLHTYGLMIAAAFVAAIIVTVRQARRESLDPAHIMDLAFWTLLFGLVGARVLFILVNTDQYFGANAMTALEIGSREVRVPSILVFWRGGLVFFGGFIGAGLAAVWYMKKHGLDVWRYTDAIVPAVPLGHFFGRLGCFAAGCCFGKACPDGGAVCAHFPSGSLAYSQTPVDTHVQIDGEWFTGGLYPTQLFESGATLLIFLILVMLRPYKRFHGQLIVTYLVLYPVVRAVIEVFRGDWGRGMLLRIPAENPVILSTSQTISLLVAAVGVALIVYRLRQLQGQRREPASDAAAA